MAADIGRKGLMLLLLHVLTGAAYAQALACPWHPRVLQCMYLSE